MHLSYPHVRGRRAPPGCAPLGGGGPGSGCVWVVCLHHDHDHGHPPIHFFIQFTGHCALLSAMDGRSLDDRTKNVLRYVPEFVPRIFSGVGETVLTEQNGKEPRMLAFRCLCQDNKVRITVKSKDHSAKAVGEKFAASPKLQQHALCASENSGNDPWELTTIP